MLYSNDSMFLVSFPLVCICGFHAAHVKFSSGGKMVHTNIKVPHESKKAQYFQWSGWTEKLPQFFLFKHLDCMEGSAYQY